LIKVGAKVNCILNRTVPLVLAIALFMEHMDSTVISTALPAIAEDIGTTPIALKLALTAYLVALAIFIPVSGWVADRFGARRVFAGALVVFMIGSIACAVSGSLVEFVLSRFLQGMGGAMMTPVGRLVLVRSTEKSDLVNAMAWLTIPALIGPLAGPPVGGFLTTFLSWHWIFLVNIPIGIAGVIFALTLLPESEPPPARRVDWTGFMLAGAAASGIVFGLSVISLPALPPVWGVSATIAGAVSFAAYVRHARRAPDPLLNPRLFANPTFRSAVIGSNLFRIGAGAVPFLLPLMLQIGFGMTPFQSGMVTFVSAGGALAMKFTVKRILGSAGFRTVLIGAAGGAAISIAVNGFFTAATPLVLIMALLFLSGLVRSLFFTSANALTFSDISDADAAQATAVTSATQQVSIAVGVALAGGVLDLVTTFSGGALELRPSTWPSSSWLRSRRWRSFRSCRCRRMPARMSPATLWGAPGRAPPHPSVSETPCFFAALEVLRQDVELDRLGARGWRLDVDDGLEVALQQVEQILFRAALERLGEEMAAGLEHADREIGGDLDQMHGAQVVRLAVADGRRGHVGEHHVGHAADRLDQLSRRVVVEEIHLQDLDAGHRVHLQVVDRRDTLVGVGRPDTLDGDLAPAAGCRAEVDHPLALLEDVVLIVDLDQLVRRPRTHALGLGPLHVGIVDLALDPAARRILQPAALLDPLVDRTTAPARCRTARAAVSSRSSAFPVRPVAPRIGAAPPDAVGGHDLGQYALAQAAVGDAQPARRPGAADRLENGAAGENEIGPVRADAWIGDTLVE
jgi:EmrB/QacA subfamily drug resistance transporter